METTILVVDRDPETRRTVARILMEDGFAVLEAGDAEEARLLAEGRQLDLLIAEEELLPQGVAARRTVRMGGLYHNLLRVSHAGQDWLSKPFSSARLRRTVQKALA